MIDIVEISHRMNQGSTKPWLCRGSDNILYVVKRQNTGFDGCVFEWVAAKLGQAFGINIPPVKLAYIDQHLIAGDIDQETELGAGTAFASTYQQNLNQVSFSLLKTYSSAELIDLFIFDYWIKNSDRTQTRLGGNPNLFFSLLCEKLIVIDHNLAFDCDFDITTFKSLHLASCHYYQQCSDLFWREELRGKYQPKLESAFSQLDNIIGTIPDDWLTNWANSSSELARLRVILSKFNNSTFWEAIS